MTPSFVIQAQLAVFLLAIVAPLVRYTAANPWEIGIFRLAVGIISLAVFLRLNGAKSSELFTRKKVLAGMSIGFVFGCNWSSFFTSLKYASVSTVAFAECSYPFFLVLFSMVVFGERIRISEVFPLLLGFSGMLIMVPSLDIKDGETAGFLLAVVAAVSFAVLATLQKLWKSLLTDSERSFFQFFFGFLFFLCFWQKTTWVLRPVDWWILIALGVFCTALAHGLWGRANAHLPGKTNAMFFFLMPVYSVILAVIFLGEEIVPRTYLGGGVIILGYFWYQKMHSLRIGVSSDGTACS